MKGCDGTQPRPDCKANKKLLSLYISRLANMWRATHAHVTTPEEEGVLGTRATVVGKPFKRVGKGKRGRWGNLEGAETGRLTHHAP